jgi:hypothetical protein
MFNSIVYCDVFKYILHVCYKIFAVEAEVEEVLQKLMEHTRALEERERERGRQK